MLSSIFQPTPPVGAETPQPAGPLSRRLYFNPLRPWGRRRALRKGHKIQHRISTHSARGGGDASSIKSFLGFSISTHSARGGGDKDGLFGPDRRNISTHSARGGGDMESRSVTGPGINFNPLRPWGRRPSCTGPQPCPRYFNPLRPWGRRLLRGHRQKRQSLDFNPLRPWGRRPTYCI